jgi:hypothetical protein
MVLDLCVMSYGIPNGSNFGIEVGPIVSLYLPAIISPRENSVLKSTLVPSYILGRLFSVVDLLFWVPHVFLFSQLILFCHIGMVYYFLINLPLNLQSLLFDKGIMSQLIWHYSLLFWIPFWQTTLSVLCWSVTWLNCTFCSIVQSSFFSSLAQLTILCPHLHS